MKRIYDEVIEQHFLENRQMLFLSGPRQVGKTTTAWAAAERMGDCRYFNWDDDADRRKIVSGARTVAEDLALDRPRPKPPVALFDEIHHYRRWKTFLKGLFDANPGRLRVMVTGSARLDVFKRGGRSLVGRYFPYRMHPLSLAELARPEPTEGPLTREPVRTSPDDLEALLAHSGFPEPFLRRSERFTSRWRRLRTEQLLREDLRDLSRIQELGQVQVLAELLRHRAGQLVSYASLSRDVNVAITTVSRWLNALSAIYYCFPVKPYHRSVARALRKEPKYYLWDWSAVPERGPRVENMAACALLKACHFWTDHGLGEFDLFFLRDKEKREVDFLVTRDGASWFLVEVKSSAPATVPAELHHFRQQTGARHAFVSAFDLPYADMDCFGLARPAIVPAATLLSQLV